MPQLTFKKLCAIEAEALPVVVYQVLVAQAAMKEATEKRIVVEVEEEMVEAATVVDLALEEEALTKDATGNKMKLLYSFKIYL